MGSPGPAAAAVREQLQEVLASTSSVAEPHSAADFLQIVQAAEEIESRSRDLLQMSVLAARSAGVTWQEIGQALSISKQAAQKRFSAIKSTPKQGLGPNERLLGPVGTFDELDELNLAGRYGWHSVDFSFSHHHVVRSANQWEHCRATGADQVASLESAGWHIVGRWFPFTLLKRDTGEPALPEP